MRAPEPVLWIWVVVAVLLLATNGRAEGGDSKNLSHGWAIVRVPLSRPPSVEPATPGEPLWPQFAWALVHLPPPDPGQKATSLPFRIAGWLREEPAAMAPIENRAYLVFGGREPGAAGSTRSVLTVAAARGTASTWFNQPEGRFESLPSLPGDVPLLGLAAVPQGAVALLGDAERADRSADRWRLWIALGTRWAPIALPWEMASGPAQARPPSPPSGRACALLTSTNRLLWLYVAEPESGIARLWTATLTVSADPSAARASWSGGAVDLQSFAPALADTPPLLLPAGDRPVLGRWGSGAGLDLWRLGRPGAEHLARLEDVPENFGVAVLSAADRVAVLWPVLAQEAGAGAPSPSAFHVRQVSLGTGRTVADGVASPIGLVSRRDVAVLAVMVVVAMLAILLSLLRPRGAGLASIPAGFVPATGGRRGVAVAVDFAIGAVVAGWIHGVDPLAIAGLARARSEADDIVPLLTAMAVACGQCMLGEWLFGRSIGKAATGCRVIRSVPMPGSAGTPDAPARLLRPRLWQAFIRNIVRWGAPPVTVFAMSDMAGRHPGDLAAGTVVVVAGEEQPAPTGSDP